MRARGPGCGEAGCGRRRACAPGVPLVIVVVARKRGSSARVCEFLVDTWCLGVKNAHLGEWDGVCDLEFGRDGMLMYIEDAHDDTWRIMHTLHQSVGDGNFHYLVGLRS